MLLEWLPVRLVAVATTAMPPSHTLIRFGIASCTLHNADKQVQCGWQVNRHRQSPKHIQQAVATMMTIRLASDHQPSAVLMAIPNELMFLIFSFLPWSR
jgi:hypothetical protein